MRGRALQLKAVALCLSLCVLPLASIAFALQTEPLLDEEPVWDGTLRRIHAPILMYHYVGTLPPDADRIRRDLTVSTEMFRRHIDYLFYNGYTPISLYDLHDALLTGRELPAKPVILTFDDGYLDHYVNVLPVLRERGFSGTFFIISAAADGSRANHLTWAQIAEMAAAGMSMEAHTKNHVELDGRTYEELIYEMLGSLESLEHYLGHKPRMFSYPVGRYDERTLQVAAQLSIWRAVTTERGTHHTTDNRLLLPRVRIAGEMSVEALASAIDG
jgi:peptidoglycan/xylan/chitin deacetylase (PgdA/CDA1 family)